MGYSHDRGFRVASYPEAEALEQHLKHYTLSISLNNYSNMTN